LNQGLKYEWISVRGTKYCGKQASTFC